MIVDYEPYFKQLKSLMDEFGYLSMKENELSAEFLFANGWKLNFVGERDYGPLYSIDLVTPPNIGIKRGHEFSREDGTEIIRYDLSLLRYVFERLKQKCYDNMPEDIISSAIKFLRLEQKNIFADPSVYEMEHRTVSTMHKAEKEAIIASHRAGIVTPAATKPLRPLQE